jgi:pimeloyl-ACP methyl ester carboxylesterase
MRAVIKALFVAAIAAAFALAAIYLLRPAWLLDAEYARQAWMAGVSKHALDASGHRWVYYEGGSGEPVLLLHGFAGSKENWLPLAAELTDRYRVIIPDLPGWGESSRHADNEYGVREQSARLRKFIGALGLPRVHLVGHSMGGHIAGVHASRHGDKLATLTLVATAGVRFEPNAFAQRVLAGQTPFNFGSVDELDAFFGQLFQQPPWLPPRLKLVLVERSVRHHAFQSALLAQIGRGADALLLEERLEQIKLPTLVLWCNGDRLLDVSSLDVLRAGLPHAAVDVLYGCSHMPMMEQPEQVAVRLVEFWRRPRG